MPGESDLPLRVKNTSGNRTRLPWWQEREEHILLKWVCKIRRVWQRRPAFYWILLQIFPPLSSPQTSAGAPGWRRPPRGWGRYNTLPPPGSATCTWERKRKRKENKVFIYLYLNHPGISTSVCLHNNETSITSLWVFAGLLSVSGASSTPLPL